MRFKGPAASKKRSKKFVSINLSATALIQQPQKTREDSRGLKRFTSQKHFPGLYTIQINIQQALWQPEGLKNQQEIKEHTLWDVLSKT